MPEEFVKMIKDGEEPIFVHPLVVAAHEKVGWTVAVETETPTLPPPNASHLERGDKEKGRKK